MHLLEREVSLRFEAVSRESYDIASNVRVVKKFAKEKQEASTQRKLMRVARKKQYQSERLWAVIENAQTWIATAGRVSVIALGGYFVLSRRCTIGDYVLFMALQDMVYGPVSQLSIILPKLRRNLSRAERLFEILEQDSSISDAPHARALCEATHSVEFRNVSFRYGGTERWTLKNVNLWVQGGAKLSGGERQRIGIARAIVCEPKILIFDEATSQLDAESERLIQAGMEEVFRGRTCFIVAHRLSTVRTADMVVVFAEGGIEAIGTHDELFKKCETYRRLYGVHLAGSNSNAQTWKGMHDGLEDYPAAVGQ